MIASGLMVAISLGAGALSPTESELAAAVAAREEAALELLERAVNINSGTLNLAGVRETGELFARAFEDLGFETQWIDGTPFQRAGHLLASHGDQGPKVLLIGHLDTVFEPDSPFQRAERLDDKRMAGPGITDMKGGNVIMLMALGALQEIGALDRLQIRVILTGDEERRGTPLEAAAGALVDAARWADIALGFEDGDGQPDTAVVARRGSSGWTLRVTGKPAHSSQIFREDIGSGAIYEAARILEAFRLRLGLWPNLTFNPGVIVGGTEISLADSRGTAYGKSNVIAERTQVEGDLRAISIEQRDAAEAAMKAIVDDSLPHTTAQIEFRHRYPPMPPSSGNLKLLEWWSQASEDLGHGPVVAVDPRRAGAADISFAAPHVNMALDGLGLMGDGGHTVDEVADLDTLVMNASRAAVLLYRLATMASGDRS